jgi:outer membrane protein OmpA-like peptidoglycan-associated protein
MPIRFTVTLAISLLLLGASYAFADGMLNDGPRTRSLGGVGNYLFHSLAPVPALPTENREETTSESLFEDQSAYPAVEQISIRQSSAIAPIQAVNFSSGSARVSAHETNRLESIAETLKSDPDLKAKITGYADSLGSVQKNEALGEARAKAVFEGLRKRGVSQSQLSFKSMGESKPASENDTEEGRAQNRRVEIQFE